MNYFEELVPELKAIDSWLPGLDDSVEEDVYNLIKCKYLELYLAKDFLNKDDVYTLEQIVQDFNISVVQDDIYSLISQMAFKAREKSNGAVLLHKAFMSSLDYENTFINYPPQIQITKVRVCRAYTKPGLVIGLCKPKYKIIDPAMMVILGRIQDKVV